MNIRTSAADSLQSDPLLLLEEKSTLFKGAELAIQDFIIGQSNVVRTSMLGILASGNVLLEGPPGTGKTRLSEVAGKVLGLKTQRIQFTSDLMPAEIIGSEILDTDPATGKKEFRFIDGPLFGAELLHADEINRASPKTQSAMLQAMQEKRVTLSNKQTRDLEKLFTVIATQNPANPEEGTYPLPRATLDRFIACVHVPHLTKEDAMRIMTMPENDEIEIPTITNSADLSEARAIVKKIAVSDKVQDYILRVDRATWDEKAAPDYLKNAFYYERDLYGSTDRGGIRLALSLQRLARASAFLQGKPAVDISDVQPLVVPSLIHRLGMPRMSEDMSAKEALEKLSLEMM